MTHKWESWKCLLGFPVGYWMKLKSCGMHIFCFYIYLFFVYSFSVGKRGWWGLVFGDENSFFFFAESFVFELKAESHVLLFFELIYGFLWSFNFFFFLKERFWTGFCTELRFVCFRPLYRTLILYIIILCRCYTLSYSCFSCLSWTYDSFPC